VGVTVVGLVLGLTGIVPAFESYGRFNGILNNPNALGYFAAPLLPPLVVYAASEPGGRRRRVMLLAITVLVVGIGLSGSRAGSLSAAAGVIVGLMASGATGQAQVARRALAVAVVALMAAALAFPALGLQVRSGTAGEALFELGTGSRRAVAWREALPLVSEQPLTGHGFGATTIIFHDRFAGIDRAALGRTHNSYLEAAVDLGWTGMVWLIALIGAGLLAAWRVSRLPGPDRIVGTALLAGIVGGAVEGTFESGLLAAGGLLAFPFWTVVALAYSLRVKQRMTSENDRRRPQFEATVR
jgi:O-antigen ligase